MDTNSKRTVLVQCLLGLSMVLCGCSSGTKVTVSPLSEKRPATHSVQYNSFWDAMDAFDFNPAVRLARTGEEETFAGCLNDAVNDRFGLAQEKLRQLHSSGMDSLIREHSESVLAEFLFAESRWNDVLALQKAAPADSENSVLTHAFSRLPKEEFIFPDGPITLPIELSSSGMPIVEVMANRRKQKCWIDTGAKLSVLASDIAEECGAKPLADEAQKAGTATSRKVDVQPTSLAEMHIGGLVIRNHPAMIIRKEDLEFKLLGFIRLMKIDGIIGWDIIRHLDITIDYKNKLLTIRQPLKKRQEDRNLFWFGYPIVRLQTEEGIPVNFGLDTGAKSTSTRQAIFSKVGFVGVDSTERRLGSAGGWETVQSKVISQLSLVVDNVLLRFKDIPTQPNEYTIFGKLDGQLGSDIAKEGIMHIDFSNGLFSIINKPVQKVE